MFISHLSKPTLLISALFASTVSWANENIDETVIVVTKNIDYPAFNPAQVLIIEREEIEQSGAQNLVQLLNNQPGFSFNQNGGVAQKSQIYLNGVDGSRILFLINGQPIGSETSGEAAFQYIPVNQIQRLEIVKGPRSTVYGSKAQGGVINIITTSDTDQSTLIVGAGAEDTRNIGIQASNTFNKTRVQLSANYEESEGFDVFNDSENDKDGYTRRSFNLNINQTLNEEISVYFDRNDQSGIVEYDGGFTNISEFDNSQTVIGLDYARGNVTSNIHASRNIDDALDEGPFAAQEDNRFYSRTNSASVSNSYQLESAFILFGADYNDIDISKSSDNLFGAGLGGFNTESRFTSGAYIGYQQVLDNIGFELGGRYDDDSAFGDFTTYNFATFLSFANGYKAAVSVATAFSAPTFNDLYSPFGGNPDLDVEESETIAVDFSKAYTLGKVLVSLQQSDFDNLIAFGPSFSSENIAKAKLKSATVQWNHNWSDQLSTQISQEWLDAKDQTTDEDLIRRVPRSTKLGANYNFAKFNVTTNIIYNDETSDIAFDPITFAPSQVTLDDYVLINAKISFKAHDQLDLGLSIDNLTDEDYETVFNYNSRGRFTMLTAKYTF